MFTRGGIQDFGQTHISFISTTISILPRFKVIPAQFKHKRNKVRIAALRGLHFIPRPLSLHCLSPLYPYFAPELSPKPPKVFLLISDLSALSDSMDIWTEITDSYFLSK
jgi:hypothetical protein